MIRRYEKKVQTCFWNENCCRKRRNDWVLRSYLVSCCVSRHSYGYCSGENCSHYSCLYSNYELLNGQRSNYGCYSR